MDRATTGHHELRRDLADDRQRSDALLEALADGVFVAQDLRFVFANPALPALLGYAHAEFVGLPFDKVVAPEFLALWTERFLRRIGGGPEPQRHYELRWLHQRGDAIWVSLRASRVIYEGRPAVLGIISDISERRKVEQALRESAELVQAVEDSVLDHMAVLDSQGEIVAVNEAWRRFSEDNSAPAERRGLGVGANYLQVCDAAAGPTAPPAAEVARGLRAVLAGLLSRYTVEYACHAPQEQRWFQLSITPLRASAGGAVVVHANITARKLVQEALANRERLYRSMVGALSEGVIIFDTQARVLACNPACERLLEWTEQQLREPAWHWRRLALTGADGRAVPEAEMPLARVKLSGQGVHEAVVGARSATGRALWLKVNAAPVFSPDGQQIDRVVISFTDISDGHAAEQLLRKLQLAAEQSPTAIIIADTDARIEYVNAAFSRISGFSREEALGRTRAELQPWREPVDRVEAMRRAVRAGEAWAGEFSNRRKDGRPFDELVRATPIRQVDGRITHYLSVVEDVTEHKRQGRELDRHRDHLEELVAARTRELAAATEAAKAANLAKSAFLANMSHEIRTPMNAIIGLAHLLRRDSVDATALERLGKLGDAAQHLLQVINDILDLSKIESGKLVLQNQAFSPAGLMQRCSELVAERAREKGLALVVESQGLPALVRGDPMRLAQALLNLLANAVKFTTEGSVQLSAQRFLEEGREPALRFEVRDTGIGIAAAQLPRLFSAFEQGDSSTTRRYGGTGLGLSITRHLIELMGGSVGAESEPGRGSLFWLSVRLPEVLAPEASMPGDAGAPAAGQAQHELARRHAGARVLLVEDNPINQEVALELLRAVGLQVVVAGDGQQALEHLARTSFDLVLMDMQMPVMDGLQATRLLRQRPDGAGLPVIAMTANAFGEDRAECLAAGMNDHVGKPVDPEQLYVTLLRWMPAGAGTAPAPSPAPSPASQPTPLDRPAGARDEPMQLQRLAALLAVGDFDSLVLYREMAAELHARFGPAAHQLGEAIRSFEFESALRLLRPWLMQGDTRGR